MQLIRGQLMRREAPQCSWSDEFVDCAETELSVIMVDIKILMDAW